MLVIGNGESRKNINIDKINNLKIGCNAIMRDYTVDYLVCVDRRMVEEAIDRKVNHHSFVYTREEWLHSYNKNNKRIRPVPSLPYIGNDRWDLPVHWGSGPYAVLLAAKLSKDRLVEMIGFDLYGTDNKINNVYKDTPSYDSSDKKAVDPRYWIYQIGKIFQCFPSIEFITYNTETWTLPQAWNYANVKVDKISSLV